MKKRTDKLEQFIKDNKNDFDSEFNPENSWSKIESKISKKKSKSNSVWMMAASIVLLLSLGWLIYDRSQLTDKINELEKLSVNNRPYSEIESYYQRNIEEKTMLVNHISAEKNIEVNTELKSLNKKYEELKAKVTEQGGHPQLVNALIQNLQTQIEILEQQLSILQDIQEYSQNDKNENNEISI
jgi:septal ring factor EnvC (AmiA/AmiB activator)